MLVRVSMSFRRVVAWLVVMGARGPLRLGVDSRFDIFEALRVEWRNLVSSEETEIRGNLSAVVGS